ncbi:MAG: Crp/Fnr family transcriptional regulator [Saprospiraceae bacterium]|nr:Crp/Fnr family transcriptional regulator [Saprospiraceae bacterium]
MTKISDIINNLSEIDKTLIDSHISIVELKKGDFAFDQFSVDNSIYYVETGLLRKYVLKDGVEKTIDFYFTDDLYFPNNFNINKPTECFLQAIEKSIIFKLNNAEFEKIKIGNLNLLALESKILEFAFSQSAERLQNFQTMTATERYQNLLEKNPKIVQQIPLIYVASYLGINNASLSKIRAKLK